MRSRISLWLSAVALLAAFGTAARADTFVAYAARSGEVVVRRIDAAPVVARIAPGMFEQGWQFRSLAAAPRSDAPSAPGGVLRALDGKTVVAVRSRVTVEGNRLRVRYDMTPDGPLTVNSVHASVILPAADWTGGTVTAGREDRMTAKIPAQASATHLIGGNVSRLELARGSARIVADGGAGGPPALLQDNRVFGGSDLEMRFGPQDGGGRAWAAGRTESFTLALDFGGPIKVEIEKPVTLQAGAEWIPLDLKLDLEPGSALDFSALNDAPAGRHGRVIVRPDGHFGFEDGPDRPARFYGVNLCFSALYPEKPLADRVAERLARIGYNTVRIHHYESGLVDPNAPDSLTFLPDSLDRLDYLFAALKKRGLYMKTDLYISRPVRASETAGEPEMNAFKMAVLVSEKAMANWQAFAKKLLTHVNPYTGIAYKDDPALAWLCVINEGNVLNFLGGLKGELRDLYQKAWNDWLRERYGTDAKVAEAWGDPAATLAASLTGDANETPRGRDVAAFAATVHMRAFARMRAFLRDEVGTKALLTDMNGWSERPAMMAARTQQDWVDNHFYWDHPNFIERDWQLPTRGWSGGGSAVDAGGAGPEGNALTRLLDRPFSISEYNYTAPNPYRAEGGLLMGAAAALQGWDAVWRFAYSHNIENLREPRPLNFFDMAADPAGLASERGALMLFLRGDVKRATGMMGRALGRDDILDHPKPVASSDLNALLWITRIGTAVTPDETAAASAAEALAELRRTGVLPAANRTDLDQGVRQSDTGELLLEARRGLFRIETPRTVGGTVRVGDTLAAGPLTAKAEGWRAAVWASSLDGQPVATSKRLLLVHVTDVQNTGMRYAAQDMQVLEAWGGLPHLARAGSAVVTLARPDAARLKAWRLDTAGRRVAPLPVKAAGGRATLDLSVKGPDGRATLYYEVVLP